MTTELPEAFRPRETPTVDRDIRGKYERGYNAALEATGAADLHHFKQAIMDALGNGSDEEAWPPGTTPMDAAVAAIHENMEQARLLGMSASRETRLRTQLEEADADIARLILGRDLDGEGMEELRHRAEKAEADRDANHGKGWSRIEGVWELAESVKPERDA